jgi:hypothetical protein
VKLCARKTLPAGARCFSLFYTRFTQKKCRLEQDEKRNGLRDKYGLQRPDQHAAAFERLPPDVSMEGWLWKRGKVRKEPPTPLPPAHPLI